MTQVPAMRRSAELNIFRSRDDPGLPVVLTAPAAAKTAGRDEQGVDRQPDTRRQNSMLGNHRINVPTHAA